MLVIMMATMMKINDNLCAWNIIICVDLCEINCHATYIFSISVENVKANQSVTLKLIGGL